MMARTRRQYSADFKIEAVRLVEEEGMGEFKPSMHRPFECRR